MPSYVNVIVTKELEGVQWDNTHAVECNALGIGGVGDDDLLAIGCGSPLTDAATNPTAPGWMPTTPNLLQAIVAWERLMHLEAVKIKRVYVTDGKVETPVVDPNSFYIAATDLTCLRDMGTATLQDIAPLSITLQLNRLPASFSQRQGHLYLRACLYEQNIRVGGPKGVLPAEEGTIPTYQILTEESTDDSGLFRFLGDGEANKYYGIPKYAATASIGIRKGQLLSVAKMSSMQAVNITPRQKNKGRKKKAS